jgi:hypothetical protein
MPAMRQFKNMGWQEFAQLNPFLIHNPSIYIPNPKQNVSPNI